MRQTNLFRLCGLLFTALCISIFLLNSCKKDDPGPQEPQEKPDQYEPNNSINEASPVAFATKISASLHNKDDVDFYKFSGTPSGKLDLLKIELSNGSDANFTITIYAKNKEEIVQVPYAGKEVDLNYQMVTEDAEFYVKVSGKDASSYPANYSLTVSFGNVADKYEPNDDITTAALFPFDTEEALNLLTGDVDFFKIQDLFKENVWDVYEVKLVNKTTDMSPAISFYDVSKTEVEELGVIAGPGKDITKQIFMKSGANNAQYLQVYAIAPFTTMPANYTLEVVKKNLNEVSEPNDTYSTAQVITLNDTYKGTIIKKVSGSNPADYDIDFIRVTIPANKSLEYVVRGSNIKYDVYYGFSLSTAPMLLDSDISSSSSTTRTLGNPNSVTMYCYIAFKAAVDLSQWEIDVAVID